MPSAAGFVGVLVITRPGVASFELGHVYALGSMLSYSLYVIMTRSMAATETPESLIFYSALAPVLFMLPVVPVDVVHARRASAVDHPAFARLLRRLRPLAADQGLPAGDDGCALAPYPYLQMVWMIFFGYVIFDQFPDRYTLMGAAIIVASGLYIVHREHRLRLKSHTAPNTEDEELAKKL